MIGAVAATTVLVLGAVSGWVMLAHRSSGTPAAVATPGLSPAQSAHPAVPPRSHLAPPAKVGQHLKVVVLDPGHSADQRAVVDPATGLTDRYYPNYPEMNDVFDVALLVRQRLLAHGGFKVLLTKKSAGQDATYRQRADFADRHHADLAVSIHDQGGLPSQGGLPFASANNEVYFQKVGMYAQPRNADFIDTGHRTYFTNERIARLSQRYARVFVRQRSAAEQHEVSLAYGKPEARDANDADIWLVQLFSKVPWIYNEAGGFSPASTHCGVDGQGRRIPDGACLSAADKNRYAAGIANSIIAALS